MFCYNAKETTKFFHYAVFRSSNKGVTYGNSFNLSYNIGLHTYIDYQNNNDIQYICILPISLTSLIIRAVFLPQSLGTSFFFFTFAFGNPISSFVTKDNGNIQYYGNQDGDLSFDSVDYKNYYQLELNPQVIFGSITSVQSSPYLKCIFVVHYQVDLHSIFTYKFQSQIKFNPQYDQEKVIQLLFSDKIKVAIAYKSKQLIIKNFKTNLSYQVNSISQIQGVQIDEVNQTFYIYGSVLKMYNFDLTHSVEITKEGFQSYQQCIITNNLIICKSQLSMLSIFNKKTFALVANQNIINQPNTFKLFVDESSSQIFICSTFVQVFDFQGNTLSQIQNINQNIVDLQLFGSTIAILTQTLIFLYQRQTLALVSSIRPVGGGNLLGYYYISDTNTVVYYADEIRYGQIFYFNLNTFQDDGFTIGSYPELGMGYVTSLFYDSLNQKINYIDTMGILYSVVTYLGQRIFSNIVKFLEFQTYSIPTNMIAEHAYNNLFVYNSNIILYFNFNDNQKSTVKIIDRSAQYFFKYLPPSTNDISQTQYFIFDKNNILYLYKDFNQIYLTYFDNKIRGVKQLDEYQIAILIFDDQFLIYTYDQISRQQISQQYCIAVINNPNFRKFLTNELILTNDQQIIHINYQFYLDGTNNWIKYTTNLGQLDDYFINSISYDQITEQKTIFTLSSGRVLLYDESSLQLKQILPVWQAQQNLQNNYVKYISVTSNFAVLGFQRNFVIVISLTDLSIMKQQDISTQTQQPLNELNIIFADEQYSRVFVSYLYQKLIIVLDMQSLQFQQYINFPNNLHNKITLNSNLLFAYSHSQVNIFLRTNLEFVDYIYVNNSFNKFLDFMIVDETNIIIPMNSQINIYVINNDYSFNLVDSSVFQQSQIADAYMQSSDNNTLRMVGISSNGIFEKRINMMVFSQQNSYNSSQNILRYSCYSQINMINRVQGQKQYQLSYNQNYQNIDYKIIAAFGTDIKNLDFIQDQKIKVIFSPDISNLNQTIALQQNTFSSIQRNQLFFQNFSFTFSNNNQVYQFSSYTKSIKWQNITIKNQNLQNIQILFQNISDVTISSLLIENVQFNQNFNESDQLTKWNQTLLMFVDCDNVFINNININTTKIWQRSLIFGFLRVNNIQIYNFTIANSNFYQIIAFQNGQTIQINQMNMFNNTNIQRMPFGSQAQSSYDYQQDSSETFSISVVGQQSTTLKDFNFNSNENILFLRYNNSYSSDSKLVTLLDDQIQILNCVIAQTKTSQDTQIITSKQINQALISLQSSYITLNNFNYFQNQGNIQIKNTDIISIQNSVFQNNTSLDGGALQFNDINEITVKNSSFYKNIAQGSGGALFLREVKKLTFDKKSSVSQNNAQIGGGIRIISSSTDPTQTIINQAAISQNVALIYGKDLGIFPFKIVINIENKNQRLLEIKNPEIIKYIYQPKLNQQSKFKIQQILQRNLGQQNIDIQQFRSGDNLYLNILFVDQYDQIVSFSVQKLKDELYPSSASNELRALQIEITAYDSIHSQASGQTFVNYNQYNENNNKFIFTSLQINSYPQSKNTFLIKAITNSFLQTAEIDVNLNIQFRECQKGEIFKTLSQYIQICEICQSGFYSLTDPSTNKQNALNCIKCPAQATSCEANQITLKDGYWRENIQSDYIIQCNQISLITTCKESDSQSKQGCIKGYIGPLCQECDYQGKLWETRFTYSSINNSCQECNKKELLYTFLIIYSFVMIIYLIASIIIFVKNFTFHSTCTYVRFLKFLPLSASCYKFFQFNQNYQFNQFHWNSLYLNIF
ncbi:hypothetical protein ABPG73_021021 [Tetrahymena malaccensis]